MPAGGDLSENTALASPPTVSEARLASVLDTAVDGIVVIDESGRILVYNKACEELFGYAAGEVLGRNVKCIMPPRYADHHDGYLARYLVSGERRIIGIGREVEGRHKDGTVIPVELSVGEARTPEGRQFIGILRDLRMRREAEDRMRDLQAQLVHMARVSAIDEMGATLAHELNQPLTALVLYLQAMQRGAGSDKDSRDLLDKALREAQRAASIIQHTRKFVEKRETKRVSVSLEGLVDEAVELTLIGSRPTGTHFVRDYDPAIGKIEADPVQIQQIVVNLLRNALDAVKERADPAIRIETRRRDGRATIAVSDNGPGVPAELVADLFKAFSSSKRNGLGLGLAISRSIAQSHGGDLTVEPRWRDGGARFELSLPLAGGEGGP